MGLDYFQAFDIMPLKGHCLSGVIRFITLLASSSAKL